MSPSPDKARRKANLAAARAAAQREREARLKAARRRRLWWQVGTPVLVVIVIVGSLLVVRANKGTDSAGTSTQASPGEAATLTQQLAAIPAGTFDAVGAGTGISPLTKISGDPLTADGKPRVLYIGAEFCPYCAGERWAMVAALSRFGTFTGLGTTTSASGDVYPNTPTLSFHGSTYTSDVVSFTGVELTTNQPSGNYYVKLETPTAADQKIMDTYDSKGSIPFLDIGNSYSLIGPSYVPDVMQGKSWQEIADAINDPSSAIGKDVLGAANQLTAAICAQTGQKPAAVCSSAGVTAAAKGLPS